MPKKVMLRAAYCFAIAALLLTYMPAFGQTDIGDNSTVWSEQDSGNNSSPPGGWPGGMNANQVEPTARSNMGALKRFWDRANPLVSTTGSAGAYNIATANTAYPVQYNQGETFCAKANFNSVGSDTLAINSLAATPMYVLGASGLVAITANYLQNNQYFCATYDGKINGTSSNPGFQVEGWSPAATAALAPYGWNALRNSSLLDQYEGTSGTFPTTVTAAANTGPDGIIGVPTGAAVTWSTGYSNIHYMQIVGASGNTDISLRFVIESIDAAQFRSYSGTNLSVTCQFNIDNTTGSSLTPKISTKYSSNASDGWSSAITDLASTNLSTIANGAVQTEAYTFTPNTNAYQGYEIILDLGALTATKSVVLQSGFDCHPTPGLATGIPAIIPPAYVPSPAENLLRDQRYFYSNYPNGDAPGTVVATTSIFAFELWNTFASSAQFFISVLYPVAMRSAPTVTIYSPLSGASGSIQANGTTYTASVINGNTVGIYGIENTSGSNISAGAGSFGLIADARILGG